MGYAMCSNIRQKIPSTSTLYINDINPSACSRFVSEYSLHGPIEIVPTAREAAENASVVISIVPGAADVKAVYLDEKTGVIAAKKDEGRLMLECSTIDVETTKEVGRKLKDRGLGMYIDAPVSVSHSSPPIQYHESEMDSRAVFQRLKPEPSPCSSAPQNPAMILLHYFQRH